MGQDQARLFTVRNVFDGEGRFSASSSQSDPSGYSSSALNDISQFEWECDALMNENVGIVAQSKREINDDPVK